jgi:hypothetical protein
VWSRVTKATAPKVRAAGTATGAAANVAAAAVVAVVGVAAAALLAEASLWSLWWCPGEISSTLLKV